MIPELRFISDVEDPIQIRRIKMFQASSFEVQWQFLQSGVPIDFSDVNVVYFVYSDNETFTETIIGSVTETSTGNVSFTFTPTNTANHGVFDFYIGCTDTSENEIMLFPYGELTLLEKAGDGITQTLPTTNVESVPNATANCNSSSQTTMVEWVDHTKTFIMEDDLTCDWRYILPTTDVPEDYIGTWWRFINRTSNICIIQAQTGGSIDDSSPRTAANTGGEIRSIDLSGTNPNPWCSIKIQLCGNTSGACWFHAVEGRRVWCTTV